MHDDKTPNPGAEAGAADEIEMPEEPASAEAARERVDLAQEHLEISVDVADKFAAHAFDARVRAGTADEAHQVAREAHGKYEAAEQEAHKKAADLDTASDKAAAARADAYTAEGKARNALTDALAGDDPAAIDEAYNALRAAQAFHKGASGVDDALRIAAEDAAEAARDADIAEDAAEFRLTILQDADDKAERAAKEADAAYAKASDVAEDARESYAQSIEAEKAVLQDADKAAADDTGSSVWGTDEDAMADALRAVPAEDAGDVEHIEMPPEPAKEQAEPSGSGAAPTVEGNASSRLMDGGGGASPIEDLRDEAFSGEEEGESAPDVAAPDAAVEGAAVGAAGDGLSIGETIEDASGPILDPPADTGAAGDIPFGGAFDPVGEAIKDVAEAAPGIGDALGEIAEAGQATAADETTDFTRIDKDFGVDSSGDVWVNVDFVANQQKNQQKVEALGDAAEDVGESTVDFVEGIPLVGDDIGDALSDGYDVVEDVVDHADDPVVKDVVDPWG